MVEGFNHKDILLSELVVVNLRVNSCWSQSVFYFLTQFYMWQMKSQTQNLNLGLKMVWLKNQFNFKHILAKSISKVYKILVTFTYYFIMFYFFNLNSDIIMKWIKISIFLIWKVIDFTKINIVAGTKKYQRLALFS